MIPKGNSCYYNTVVWFGEIEEEAITIKGVRQGFTLSPTIFNTYIYNVYPKCD